MARLKSAVSVSEHQELLLEKLAARPTTSQHLVLRARIVLFTFQGLAKATISEQLGVDSKTVAWWRKRWISHQDVLVDFERNIPANQRADKVLMRKIVDVLSDAPRQGAPPKFTQEQVKQIVALACEAPEDVGVPMSHWTNEVLARELARRGIVESISSTRVWEILKKYGPPST